ncbi:hypothetical protein CEQ21_07950 (plasmid) [Niallia circulans]|uniref:Uncharacterized protein n=1 Tax=Niallia circulans TaxID=1397 RepID=A0A553SQM3_NIACI|nr:hypothetical protein [Niallia circulans]TRZ39292.1 hypothetical protein CEQ21_07950 [Niallia circulans]
MKLKMIIFTLLFIFLFYFSLFIAGFFPFIAEHKKEFSTEVLGDYSINILVHPFENINEMHEEKNPMLYVSTAAAFVLFIYILFKTRHKDYENVGDKYGVQGSSRWARNTEIFKVPDQITILPSKSMYDELKKTLKAKDNEVK